jgi:predicted GNAT family N-acyltransferase
MVTPQMSEKMQILRLQKENKAELSAAFAIRKKVFVEEQEVGEADEFDEFEEESHHYLLKVEGKPIATARWRFIGDKIKCERFALLEEFRNQGFGSVLLNEVINDVKNKSSTIYLHAQLKAIPFYERIGFQKVGDQFTECEIEHFKMVLGK